MSRRLFPLVLLGVLVLLTACGEEPEETVTEPQTEELSPVIEPEFVIDEHLLVVYEWTACFQQLNNILDTIIDAETGRQAQPLLDGLTAGRLTDLRLRANRLAPPGPELANDQAFQSAGEQYSVEQQRFFENLQRIDKLPEIEFMKPTVSKIFEILHIRGVTAEE